MNEELGYTPDLADVWDKRGLREAWVFISDTEREYPFIAGILLVDSVKEARKLPEEVHFSFPGHVKLVKELSVSTLFALSICPVLTNCINNCAFIEYASGKRTCLVFY